MLYEIQISTKMKKHVLKIFAVLTRFNMENEKLISILRSFKCLFLVCVNNFVFLKRNGMKKMNSSNTKLKYSLTVVNIK